MLTTKQESTLNLPFRVVATENEHGIPFTYVDNEAISIAAHLPLNKAKERFRTELQEEIDRALRATKHTQRHYIGMGNGTVFCLYWNAIGDGWGYDIAGPDRKYASGGSTGPRESLEQTIEYVKQGFADVNGGVVWEC